MDFRMIRTSPNYDKVEARITVSQTIPDDMWGNVYVAWFDPDNPQGSTKTPATNGPGTRDNHGSIKISDNNPCVTFDANTNHKGRGFQFIPISGGVGHAAHAGDNYIVAAHPNSGVANKYRFQPDGETLERPDGSSWAVLDLANPKKLQTKVLTVWRTLNIECDVMKYYPGSTNTGTPIEPPSPATLLSSFVAAELARASVVTKVYAPNNSQPPIGHNPITNAEINNILPSRQIPGTNPPQWEIDPTNTTSGRDIKGNSPDYWAVRIVTASSYTHYHYGDFNPGYNTTIIYYQEIIDKIKLWNITGQSPLISETEAVYIESTSQTLLHELGHVLIDDSHASDKVMNPSIQINQKLEQHYQIFLDDDICKIQQYSRARN